MHPNRNLPDYEGDDGYPKRRALWNFLAEALPILREAGYELRTMTTGSTAEIEALTHELRYQRIHKIRKRAPQVRSDSTAEGWSYYDKQASTLPCPLCGGQPGTEHVYPPLSDKGSDYVTSCAKCSDIAVYDTERPYAKGHTRDQSIENWNATVAEWDN